MTYDSLIDFFKYWNEWLTYSASPVCTPPFDESFPAAMTAEELALMAKAELRFALDREATRRAIMRYIKRFDTPPPILNVTPLFGWVANPEIVIDNGTHAWRIIYKKNPFNSTR